MASAAQGEVQILQDVHTAEQGEGTVVGEGDVAELNLSCCHHRPLLPGGAYRLCFVGL